jgi:AraC family cel operon transcriptional repressor
MLLYTFESIKYSPYTAIYMNPSDRKHKLQFWKITYAINGQSEIVINGEKKPLRNNTLLFVKPTDILQNTNFTPPHEYKHRDIYISDERLQEICQTLPVNPYKKLLKRTVYLNVSRLQTDNLEFLLNSFPLNSEEKNPQLDTLHQTVIINCLMMFIQSTMSSPKPPAWLVEIADRVTLDEYLQNDVSYFLRNLNYSKRHVCRSFQKYYGMTPTEYLTKAKIVQSTNYLMDKRLLIVDIAQRLGFSTQSGFIKAFKAYFNISPNAWRKKYLTDKHTALVSKFGETEDI